MYFSEFQERSAATDRMPSDSEGLRIALLGVAGEAGSVVSEAKKSFRDDDPPAWLAPRVGEELGDLLWYVAAVARRLDLDLGDVAAGNLEKVDELWQQTLPPPPAYDAAFPERQRFPRRMAVRFEEDTEGEFPLVRMRPLGELARRIEEHEEGKRARRPDQVGDDIDDNAHIDDGYRYHDVLHLAHAAVLGWSPVFRALMGAKRKDDAEVDRVEDGARAIAIEEGLAAFVFNYVEERGFLEGLDGLGWELVKHVRRTVRGLEVADQPAVAWERTYVQAFDVFRILRERGGGIVACDLDDRSITLVPDDEAAAWES